MNKATDLQQTLRESRRRLSFHYTALSDELNVVLRLRYSIQRKPWWWVGGALTTGIIASFCRGSHRVKKLASPTAIKTKKSSSLMGHLSSLSSLFLGETSLALAAVQLVRFAAPIIRPVITEYVSSKINTKQTER